MKNKFLTFSFLAVALMLVTVPMFAHHGTAVYDNNKKLMLNGTVTKFEFVNPHILVYIDAPDASGTMRNWVIENSPPSLAMHSGWTKDMMKVGDKVEYEIQPARNGASVGRGGSAITVNGKKLGAAPGGAGAQ